MRGTVLKQVLLLQLLMVLVLMVLGCGPHVSKPRPLPDERQELSSGVYRSEEFKPSFTFRVGEGWSNEPPEVYDALLLTRGHDAGGLGFANLKWARFYKATKSGTPYAMDVPEDIAAWFRHHPYLRTSEPRPVTVGGVEGVRLDVAVEDLPDNYSGLCGSNCVDLFRLSSGGLVILLEQDKARIIVLEDVRGKRVLVGFVSPANKFDEHAQEAQKVIDTVQWTEQ